MGGALPASYYNPTGVSQAQQQATMYGGQNYVPPTGMYQTPNNLTIYPTASSGYYTPPAGNDLSSMYGANPYVADYSNPNIYTDPSTFWSFTPAGTDQTTGLTPSTSPQATTSTQPLGKSIFRTIIPMGEDYANPSWLSNPDILDYQYMTDPSGANQLVAYSRSAIPGGSWSSINTLGYQDAVARNLGLLGGQGYSMYNPDSTSAYDQLYSDYKAQMDQINNLIDQVNQPVEVPEVNLDDYQVEGNQGQSIWEPFSWGGLAEKPPAGQEGILPILTEEDETGTAKTQPDTSWQYGIYGPSLYNQILNFSKTAGRDKAMNYAIALKRMLDKRNTAMTELGM